MMLMCPNCMGELVAVDDEHLRCTLDGKTYSVLCCRYQLTPENAPPQTPVAPQTAPPAPEKVAIQCTHCGQQYRAKASFVGREAKCKNCASTFMVEVLEEGRGEELALAPAEPPAACARHPDMSAEFQCSSCGNGICATCDFPQADGSHICPGCMTTGQRASRPAMPHSGPYIPPGTMCAQHPGVQAVQICQSCKAAVCATCDFEFPGNIHVCPTCASTSDKPLSEGRKTRLTWSYVLAVVSTVMLIIFFIACSAAQTEEALTVISVVMGTSILIMSIVGTALGGSVRDRRLSNPVSILIATLWNGIILGIYLLLCVIGLFMGG